MGDYPTFEGAVARFRDFLQSQGLPDAIIWVGPEDVALVKRRIGVRVPSLDVAVPRAAADDASGGRAALGVKLAVLCRIDDQTCCYLYAPQEEGEAVRHLMPDGLKLSIPVPVPTGLEVPDRLNWWIVRWLSRRRRTQIQQVFERY